MSRINRSLLYFDELSVNPLRRLGIKLSYPEFAIVELTNRCNSKCIYCLRSNMSYGSTRPYGEMSLETFKDVVKPFLWSLDSLGLNGFGDSLLCKTFIPAVEYLRSVKRSLNLSIHTNGLVLTRELSKSLVFNDFDSISVSLDAATTDTYRKVRGGSFHKVLGNLADLIDVKKQHNRPKPFITVSFTIVEDNIDELPMFVELAHKLGVPAMPILLTNTKWGYCAASKCDRERLVSAIDEARGIARRLKVPIKLPDIGDPRMGSNGIEHYKNYSCAWPFKLSPYITYDGYVLLCGWMIDPRQVNLGNVLQQGFFQVWNGAPMRKIRRDFARGDFYTFCKDCRSIGKEYDSVNYIDW